jgi:hypothetical protein
MRYSAPCWPAARGPDRGGALQRLFGALYGEGYLNGCSNCTVAKAPARGAVERSRGGVQARLGSARGDCDPARGNCCDGGAL